LKFQHPHSAQKNGYSDKNAFRKVTGIIAPRNKSTRHKRTRQTTCAKYRFWRHFICFWHWLQTWSSDLKKSRCYIKTRKGRSIFKNIWSRWRRLQGWHRAPDPQMHIIRSDATPFVTNFWTNRYCLHWRGSKFVCFKLMSQSRRLATHQHRKTTNLRRALQEDVFETNKLHARKKWNGLEP